MIKAFPKIFQLGTRYTHNIFEDDVEITEKIDGSQFVFGKVNGQLYVRSKGAELQINAPEKLFEEGVKYVASIESKIPDNTVFYCEYLKKPKHNVLCYDRIPKNHLILFGVAGTDENFDQNLVKWAEVLDIESVPVVYRGKVDNAEELGILLKTVSCLGTVHVEGVVIKNYAKTVLVGGQVLPLMSAKYVSEAFKEVHRGTWGKENTGKGQYQTFVESFKTEARWLKAIQRLEEAGTLDKSNKDIGTLMNSVKEDIVKEEMENIKDFLWKTFNQEILRGSVNGLAEWYKEKLMKESFPVVDNAGEYDGKGTYKKGVDPEVTCWHCEKTFLCDPMDATCRLCHAPYDKSRCAEFNFIPKESVYHGPS